MSEEQPVTALSTEPMSESAAWREWQAAQPRSQYGRERKRAEDATMRYAAHVRRLAVADLRASLAAEVRREVEPLIVGTKFEVLAGQAVLRAVLRLIEGDTDARER